MIHVAFLEGMRTGEFRILSPADLDSAGEYPDPGIWEPISKARYFLLKALALYSFA